MLDYDNDGWMDLFVSNDTEPNKLYHNNHDGTFTDVAIAAGVAFSDAGTARAGMGTDAADYDGSGWQSLVIGNFTNESMALYHNDGSGLFTDEAPTTRHRRISTQSLTFGTFFFDYDLDGLPDLLAVNGHVSDDIAVVQPTLKYAQPPHLFRNLGKKKFEEVTARVGSALPRAIVGRGAAYADFDNDGDLDLLITANNGPARLLRNDYGNQNDMLRVKTRGTRLNRDGIGAKVTVKTSKGMRLFGMVKTGSSYLSQSELPLTFGLGRPEAGKTVSVTIVWTSGQKDSVATSSPTNLLQCRKERALSRHTRSFLRQQLRLLLTEVPLSSFPFRIPVRCYLCRTFMDILQQLFGQHFHTPAEQVQPLQGQLGGSGRKIIRLSGGRFSAIGILYDVREENVAFLEFSRHFRRHGLPVPEIYAEDLDQALIWKRPGRHHPV